VRSDYIIYIVILFSLISCNNNEGAGKLPRRPDKDEMAEMNSYFVQKDRELIGNYIERKNLKMTESRSGMWYMIPEEGKGDLFSDNDTIIMEYNCYLLDGTLCYSSDELGPKVMILGKSAMEAGLNEGLRMLRPGARATFIIPPYLAYGFVGDRKKIPARSVIVYNVSILQTQ
jgi:FKBP-type peptidyl-prolyl cis-trans isomerase